MALSSDKARQQALQWEDEISDHVRRELGPGQKDLLLHTEFVQRRLTPWSELLAAYKTEVSQEESDLHRIEASRDVGSHDGHLDEWNLPPDIDSREFQQRHNFRRIRKLRIGCEFWGFLNLPIEIRRLIYQELLVVGKIFVPQRCEDGVDQVFKEPLDQLLDAHGEPYFRYRDYESFQITKQRHGRFAAGLILGVCKTVQFEAMAIFYGQNQLVFPFGSQEINVMQHNFDPRHQDPFCWLPYLRDISVSFDMRNTEDTLWTIRHHLIQMGHINVRSPPTQLETLQLIHEHALNNYWDTIESIVSSTRLQRLHIDFEECFCVLGCCRLALSVCEPLQQWALEPPESILISGHTDDAERDSIREKLTTLNGQTNENRVRFLGLSMAQKINLYALDSILTA